MRITNLNSCLYSYSIDIFKNLKRKSLLNSYSKKLLEYPCAIIFLLPTRFAALQWQNLCAFNLTCFTEQQTELFLTKPQNISEKDLERQLKEGQRKTPQIALTSKK